MYKIISLLPKRRAIVSWAGSLLTVALLGWQLFGAPAQTALAFNIFSAGGAQGVCSQAPGATACEADSGKKSNILGNGGLLGTILGLMVYAAAIISVIMVTIGGIRYAVSGGDSAGVQSAKNTIIYGLVGLVIAVFGGAIVHFTLGYF